ncbi:uncharacterized protein LOC129571009 [Sitodiplosis mosellana]|uniref:uncharacterized protein LOC129571009 n=1 Tax=Sitodiplosis mosellana TaxID=263140 RepID=UPI0024451036|nr:uncharacterized protein LOC129571009 [Sitodiplosis mosellana]
MSDEENKMGLNYVFGQIALSEENYYFAYTQLEKHSRCFEKHIVKLTEIIGQKEIDAGVRKQAALEFLRRCSSDNASLKNYIGLKYSQMEETHRKQLVKNLKFAMENVDLESLVEIVCECWGAMIELDGNLRKIDICELLKESSNIHQNAAKLLARGYSLKEDQLEHIFGTIVRYLEEWKGHDKDNGTLNLAALTVLNKAFEFGSFRTTFRKYAAKILDAICQFITEPIRTPAPALVVESALKFFQKYDEKVEKNKSLIDVINCVFKTKNIANCKIAIGILNHRCDSINDDQTRKEFLGNFTYSFQLVLENEEMVEISQSVKELLKKIDW